MMKYYSVTTPLLLLILLSNSILIHANNTQCIKTGCSGELCSDHPLISPCIWQEYYKCYQNAKCEYQDESEKCGFKKTVELEACLRLSQVEGMDDESAIENTDDILYFDQNFMSKIRKG